MGFVNNYGAQPSIWWFESCISPLSLASLSIEALNQIVRVASYDTLALNKERETKTTYQDTIPSIVGGLGDFLTN